MSTVAADLHAPSRTLSVARSDSAFAAVSAVAYAASMIKWVVRDPLSTDTGAQALVEIALLGVAVLAAAVPIVRRRAVFPIPTPPVIGFALFAVFAMISSMFSYWPELSLVKGTLFLAVTAIALFLCTARPPTDVLRYLYWSICAVIICGACWKLMSGEPIFELDEFSGRQRLTLFGWHANTFADLSATAFLVGRLLPRRPSWIWQGLLLALVVLSGARAVGIALILVVAVSAFWTNRRNAPVLAGLLVAVSTVALFAWTAYMFRVTVDVNAIDNALEGFYGSYAGEEVATLNGRTDLWRQTAPLLAETVIFGYGVDGARAAILADLDWAGHSHNAYFELLLAAGGPGLIVFFIAWGFALASTFRMPAAMRPLAWSIHGYIFMQGMADPNITALQYLPVFLIVRLDALARHAGRSGLGELPA